MTLNKGGTSGAIIRGRVSAVRPVWLGIGALAIITLIFSTTQSPYTLYIYDSVLMACLGAVALQVLQGTAGLVSVGTAGFLLLGAFSSVFILRSGAPFPIDVIGGAAVAGVAGLIAGLPALRLRALFLVLATLAIHYVAVFIGILYENHVPAASVAGFVLPTLFVSTGLDQAGRYWAWLLFPCVALVIIAASRIMRARSGRALRMIRGHEHVAPTLGISVPKYKLILFAMSSAVIGLEGGLTAHFSGVVSTGNYSLTLAFQYVAMILIGGVDSILGAVLGAAIVVALPVYVPKVVGAMLGGTRAVTDGPNIALIVYGILVVIFVTASPDGVVGLLKKLRRLVQRSFSGKSLTDSAGNLPRERVD
jgi:branched-chain amino acid transport system permease protein